MTTVQDLSVTAVNMALLRQNVLTTRGRLQVTAIGEALRDRGSYTSLLITEAGLSDDARDCRDRQEFFPFTNELWINKSTGIFMLVLLS
jgi:hypothetical protein